MARRIITAAIFVPILIFIILFDNIYLLTAVIAGLSVVAVYEILLATKYLKNKTLTVISLGFSALFPFCLCVPFLRHKMIIICGLFIISLFVVMLMMHEVVSFEEIALVAFVSVALPIALTCIPLSRIRFEEHGIFCVVFILLIPWIGDAGAYFVGTFFGKHKMAPKISPKKSWEGLIGAVMSSGAMGYFSAISYQYIANNYLGMPTLKVDAVYLTIIAVVCSILGVLGDLSASLIKRQCSVKDFGNIMPGHGGVLDRFDSILFVAPFVYHAFTYFSPFQ